MIELETKQGGGFTGIGNLDIKTTLLKKIVIGIKEIIIQKKKKKILSAPHLLRYFNQIFIFFKKKNVSLI